ncbi:nuclear transcription factor Y subunit B-6-like [Sesamum indicum]|uniref:Nuclear transcription factor Y subunit B-6-like n=1 Tax=Sesamum indicum TaxID=4182 RepID=A0A6I9UCA3_SESIN|nr:nuclear transcription factor Y subunit B-6-like [Sesamum indicum]
MESGGSSNPKHKSNTKRTPQSGIVIREPSAAPANIPNNAAGLNPEQTFKRDPDQYMPIANVIRIMRRILPAHAKIADDAKETIQECVSEFIGFITSEANDKCHREYRKTITPDDVLSAMGTLGFDNYIEPLTFYLNRYRAQDPERASMHQLPFIRRAAGPVQPRPAAQMPVARPPPLQVPPQTAMRFAPPARFAVEGGNYAALPQIGDYFVGNEGGGEGSSGGYLYDRYRQFR